VRAALAFLTPLGGARQPSPRALPWFPVVGALIGAGVGTAWWGATEVWSPAVGAAVALVVDLALTGMLHMDGVGDTADGLLPPLPRERRLAVMAQPDVGAFGVAALGSVLLLRFAVLASMAPDVWLVVLLWSLARSLSVWHLALGTYARPGGLATAFTGGSPTLARVVALSPYLVAVAAGHEVLAGTAVVLGYATVTAFARRRVGGYTGDVLGAAIVVGETTGLLVAAA
jgi:adenosylcobinamide-GDP ribazoletransferase